MKTFSKSILEGFWIDFGTNFGSQMARVLLGKSYLAPFRKNCGKIFALFHNFEENVDEIFNEHHVYLLKLRFVSFRDVLKLHMNGFLAKTCFTFLHSTALCSL